MANANVIHTQDWNLTGSTGLSSTRFLRGDGTWADPIGIQPAFSNVVFIAKNGDDTTALAAFTAASNKGVLAYPFLTIAAARSAVAGAATASATNRWLGKIMGGGTWAEQLVLLSYMDWDLGNAIIDLQAGALYTIDDNNAACDSIIYGNATIKRSTAGTLGCIRTQNANTTLRLKCNEISTTTGNAVVCTNGTIIMDVVDNITTTFNGATAIVHTAGTQTINVAGQTGIVSSGTTAIGVSCAAGTLEINTPVITSAVTGVSHAAGTFTINGNISAVTTGITSAFQTNSNVNGNITVSNGQGIISTGANNGTIFIKGNITTTNDDGINLSNGGAGVQITGNITSTGGTGGCIVLTNISNVTVRSGTITNTGSDFAININNSTVNLFDCNVSSSATSAFSGASTYIIDARSCRFTSAGADAIVVGLPSATGHGKFENCYIKTTNTDSNAVLVDGGSGSQRPIFKDCVFIANGTGKSILASSARTVKIYGTCTANADVEVTDVTIWGGSLIVDPTAVYGVSVGTQIQ